MKLREFFNLTRPLVVLDCETSGTNPKVDRICELGFQIHYPENWEKIPDRKLSDSPPDNDPLIFEWRTLVDPGLTMLDEVIEVHGIRNEEFLRCTRCKREQHEHPWREERLNGTWITVCEEYHRWPTFKELAPNLARGLTDVDFAGKTVRFDLGFLSEEMMRAKVNWSYKTARIIDADRLEQLGDPRTLSHLYKKHIGKEAENAHQALADVRMTTEVIQVQLIRYSMPRNLDDLHQMQWPNWIDNEGKFTFNKNGVPCFSRWGKYANRPMHVADPSYWDFVLKGEFSTEIKALASEAKLRRFPVKA